MCGCVYSSFSSSLPLFLSLFLSFFPCEWDVPSPKLEAGKANSQTHLWPRLLCPASSPSSKMWTALRDSGWVLKTQALCLHSRHQERTKQGRLCILPLRILPGSYTWDFCLLPLAELSHVVSRAAKESGKCDLNSKWTCNLKYLIIGWKEKGNFRG